MNLLSYWRLVQAERQASRQDWVAQSVGTRTDRLAISPQSASLPPDSPRDHVQSLILQELRTHTEELAVSLDRLSFTTCLLGCFMAENQALRAQFER